MAFAVRASKLTTTYPTNCALVSGPALENDRLLQPAAGLSDIQYVHWRSNGRVVAAPEIRLLLPTAFFPRDNVTASKPIDSLIDATVAGSGVDRTR